MKFFEKILSVAFALGTLVLMVSNPNIAPLKNQPATWWEAGALVEKDENGNPYFFQAMELAQGAIYAENGSAVPYTPADKLVEGKNTQGQKVYWLCRPDGAVLKVALR